MVGLCQALLLARQLPTTQIVLLEAHRFESQANAEVQSSFDARSTAVSAASVDILSLLDIWSSVETHAEAIRRVHVSDRGHVGTTAYSEADNQHKALGYVVENRWFGQQLMCAAQAADNIDILAPAQVSEVLPLSGRVRIQYALGETDTVQSLEAGLVIIADGAESPLRRQLGVATDVHDYQQCAVIANLEFELPHCGQAFERFTEEGPLALLPLPSVVPAESSKRVALVWTRPNSHVNETLALDNEAFTAAIQQSFGYRMGRCLRVGARHHYPLKMMLAREQVRSQLAFVGNAAHFLHPVAGQGFNLALRDCAQLTAVLGDAFEQKQPLGALAVLNRYIALQENDQSTTRFISHNFIRVFANQHLFMQAGRNVGLLGLGLSNTVKKAFFAQMMGRSLPLARLSRARVGKSEARTI